MNDKLKITQIIKPYEVWINPTGYKYTIVSIDDTHVTCIYELEIAKYDIKTFLMMKETMTYIGNVDKKFLDNMLLLL